MPITDKQLTAFADTAGGLLDKAAALAGLALGPTAALAFGAESVFRFLRLGFSIRRARLQANRQLDEAVRLQEIPREAIHVDLKSLVIYLYARDGGFERDYPKSTADQFQTEIEEVRGATHFAVRARTKRILVFADRYLPQLTSGGGFRNRELQELFGRWLDPIAPRYRLLFAEMAELFPSDAFSERQHRDRTAAYFSRSMENFGLRLDLLTFQEQSRLTETVRGLVWDAILGGGGQVQKTGEFLAGLKKNSLQLRLEALRRQLDALDRRAEPRRAADLEREIDELEKWKKRL